MTEERVLEIPLENLRPSKTQPRKSFPTADIKELADSIATHGIIQPLIARPDWTMGKSLGELESINGNHPVPTFFEIVAGERRYRAAGVAKMATAPVIIRLLPDQDVREIQLIENLQREDLSAIEEAAGYSELLAMRHMGKAVYTVEKIALAVGKTTSRIYRRLKLLGVPDSVRKLLDNKSIDSDVAEQIGSIPTPTMREAAAQEILHPSYKPEPMSRRETREWIADNYMRSLSGAPFEQSDAALVPAMNDDQTGERIGGGACADCPRRSGNMLEGNAKRPDICTNTACFAMKTDAAWKRLNESSGANGKRVLTAEETKGIFDEKGNIDFGSEYVALDERPDREEVRRDVKKLLSWKKLLEDVAAKPEIVVARDPRGRLRELLKRAVAIEAIRLAAKQKGETSIFDSADRPGGRSGGINAAQSEKLSSEQAAAREKRKLDFEIAKASMTELVGALVEKGGLNGAAELLIDLALSHAGCDGQWFVSKRLGLEPVAGSLAGQNGPDYEATVRKYSSDLSIRDQDVLVIELLLAKSFKFFGVKDEMFLRFAKLYDLDLKAIALRVRQPVKKAAAQTIDESSNKKEAKPAVLTDYPHEFEKITGNKYRCKGCGAAAVKHKGKLLVAKDFRGKSCSRSEAETTKKCSHCPDPAAPGKSMCPKCLAKNAHRAKARRAKVRRKP